MKRIATLLSGAALAAAMSFGAQAPASSAPAKSSIPTASVAKKHVKKHKKAAKTTANPAPATLATPAKK